MIKAVLKVTLSDYLDKKYIVYTNTANCLDQLKVDVEHWLDSGDGVKGDSLIIQGDMKAEVNFVSAQMFTITVDNAEELVNSNSLYPMILMATAGSIGAGLDSEDIYRVVRVGFRLVFWRWCRRWVDAVEEDRTITILLHMIFIYCCHVEILFISTNVCINPNPHCRQ